MFSLDCLIKLFGFLRVLLCRASENAPEAEGRPTRALGDFQGASAAPGALAKKPKNIYFLRGFFKAAQLICAREMTLDYSHSADVWAVGVVRPAHAAHFV